MQIPVSTDNLGFRISNIIFTVTIFEWFYTSHDECHFEQFFAQQLNFIMRAIGRYYWEYNYINLIELICLNYKQ